MARGTDVTDFKQAYRTVREEEFPEELTLTLKREASLRYGENPNQPAALYCFSDPTNLAALTNIHLVKTGKGGLSATNYMDVTRARGVSAVIQPRGSKRDHEVIQAANEHKMAMVFTLERCFSHF